MPDALRPRLNARAALAGPSPTMAAAAAACRHPEPVDLTVGEPDVLPPEAAREAAALAARQGLTKYGPAAGLPGLRERLAADLAARDGVPRPLEHVVVTAGGKAAIHDALRCILGPGDEVLLFAPYWPTFRDQVLWNGGVPVVVPKGPDLLPRMEVLEASIGPRTRAVILNQPCNPSGRSWDAGRIRHLAALAERHDLWLILDQVYGTLGYDGPEAPFLRAAPQAAGRCVVIESFSKRFAMTGYRLGAAAAPSALVRAMVALASSTVTHPCMLSQHAGIAALATGGGWEAELRDSLRRRRDLAAGALRGFGGIDVQVPEGALYLFPEVAGWMEARGVPGDAALAGRLRDEAGVKVLPGSVFGAPGHLRISFAAPQAALREGLERLRRFFGRPA